MYKTGWGLAVLAGWLAGAGWLVADNTAEGVEFFEKRIRPVLVEHCLKCHGDKESKGGLRLDSRAGWMQGGDSGPAVVAGKPDDSLLIQAIRYGGDYEMPPSGRLPDALIHDLEDWVRRGAPDPRIADAGKRPAEIDIESGRRHWAYRPLAKAPLPAVKKTSWPVTVMDRFVLAKIESNGLRPAADAPREVLVRRLYFDLIGLPPTPDEMDAFLQDEAPDAYERLVDRLMASPHFGERWGRRWLDVARFAESLTLRGFILKEAWRYRDYVIDVFNSDLPYDQFVREQIAGDLLPADSLADRQRRLIATTYLALG
jgi:mono/diheme cytochrome c family protein